MNYKLDEILLVDEFRPSKVAQVVLPNRLKQPFLDYVDAKGCPNLLLSGPRGIGKTTLVLALADEINATFMKVNASNEGVDTIRTKVAEFASAMNASAVLFGEEETSAKKRIVLFDEFDGMSKKGQEALRGFIEEYQSNCIFVFTCNYKEKIIEAIYSRCKCIDFQIRRDEYKDLMTQFFHATRGILDKVGIKYEPPVVAALIKEKFPDFRAVLNEIQGFAMNGVLDSSILADLESGNVDELYGYLKAAKWDEMRKWIATNGNIDEATVLSRMISVQMMDKYVMKQSQPDMLEIVEEFLHRMGSSRDPQITLAAACTVVMKSVKFK